MGQIEKCENLIPDQGYLNSFLNKNVISLSNAYNNDKYPYVANMPKK
jgi:hypothetical protein